MESLEDYVVNIRPRYGFPTHPALWLTERGGRLRAREIEDRFALYREELGLPNELTPHCLRHSYVTHGIEDGVDPKFIQEQVGHLYASTTALYTNPRELHQTGEKSQVARSRRGLEGLRGYYDLAA
ncbi:tyrosine recombinase XerC [Streptomyces sp. DSM 116494]|uniref:site-specific integrase n=1 Tax=Streptomyces okerensis TaxID=3344655 RepID=UPI00388F3B92